MERKDYASKINWRGVATREMQVGELPCYEIGETVNPGLCWTDGGEFTSETPGKYTVVFEIVTHVDGHAVDYDNEEECWDLGCQDCEKEKEILIDREFVVVDFWEWDEETEFAKVFIEAK